MGAEGDERRVVCEKGVLSRAAGSVRWRQGGTEVLAAVHGPAPAMQRKAQADRAVVEVTWRPLFDVPGNAERLNEAVVRQTVEACALLSSLPQSMVSVTLQVVSDDGSLLACALNATCAVLMDAGIPLHHPLVAVSCALLEDGTMQLHPNSATEKGCCASAEASDQSFGKQAAASVLTAAFGRTSPAEGSADAAAQQRLGLMTSQLDGRAGPTEYLAALDLCQGAYEAVLNIHRQALLQTLRV